MGKYIHIIIKLGMSLFKFSSPSYRLETLEFYDLINGVRLSPAINMETFRIPFPTF